MINDNIAFGKLMFDFIEYLKLAKAGITNITTVVSFASLSDSDELATSLFHNITYNMSHTDIITAIGEHEFKAIMAYYLTEFNKED